MIEIAFYGKGGIGKSTISANISAALATQGKKILQIGCDPKHDSTRLLLHGRNITTVLDYLKQNTPDQCKLEDVLFEGFRGIHCVEAGGPEPGVGCAGRGILTTFELLERLGIKNNQYDTIVYDVLGDVVCGGFAVPLRQEYADKVYIVTSGEYMSIYAANNILRGLKNYDLKITRAGGLIFNARGIQEEEERIKRFSEAVELPVLNTFPRSDLFAESEKNSLCLVEKYPDSILAKQFIELGDFIFNQSSLHEAKPLTDERLEEIVLEKKVQISVSQNTKLKLAQKVENKSSQKQFFSKSLVQKEPIHGCAYNGAMGITTQIEDSISISHGPNSCAHISYQTITSSGRRSMLIRGTVLPSQVVPPIISSEMNEGIMIFGGISELREKVKLIKEHDPKIIFIVTTCASGIIGDDINSIKELSDKKTQIIPIPTEGNINGDFLQGIILSYLEIGRNLINKNVLPKDNTINLIAEKQESDTTDINYSTLCEMLNRLSLKVNCRFICRTNSDDIRNLLQGKLNILAYDDYMGRTIKEFLQSEYNAPFLEDPLPVGFEETKEWITKLAVYFNKQELIEDIIKEYTYQYKQEINKIKIYLKGKKLAIISCNYRLDWIIQTALDLEMEVIKVCTLYSLQDNLFQTRFKEKIGEIVLNCPHSEKHKQIPKYADLILLDQTSYDFVKMNEKSFTDTIPFGPEIGFFSGITLANRWKEIFQMNLKEGWRNDEFLFKKHIGG